VRHEASATCAFHVRVRALLLQGGGALGAYQAGVCQALSEARLQPDWVAGTSIGAINAALIAGNAPENRVARPRGFWEGITPMQPVDSIAKLGPVSWMRGEMSRGLLTQLSAGAAIVAGVPGFFEPSVPFAWLHPPGSLEATSYYDTAPLKSTLEPADRLRSPQLRRDKQIPEQARTLGITEQAVIKDIMLKETVDRENTSWYMH
jgi:NTE family protein